MKLSNSVVSITELNTSLADYGIEAHIFRGVGEQQEVIGNGSLCFERGVSGVGIHCSDILIEQNASSSTQRSACFTVNIVMQGEVNFTLGNNDYRFAVEDKPLIFVCVFQEGELFTRTLFSGQYIRKVNVEVPKEWLLERCKQQDDQQFLSALFTGQSKVFSWEVNEALLAFANQLFEGHESTELCQRVQCEHYALTIIGESLSVLKTSSVDAIGVSADASPESTVQKTPPLPTTVVEALLAQQPLAKIAQQQGMSVSTLQRRFKAQFSMSMKDYLRKARLDRARKAILIDGISIGEAAFAAGYSHVANFVTAFRKQFQQTPAALRAVHLNVSDDKTR